ncbi:hypothetical protein [Streptosporangium sandarakinum]
MPPTFIKVRHRETGATAEISPNALRHFPDYEAITPEADEPSAAPKEQPQPSKTTPRRAPAATEKE